MRAIDLKRKFKKLHFLVEEMECFSVSDLLGLVMIQDELTRRGYRVRKKAIIERET